MDLNGLGRDVSCERSGRKKMPPREIGVAVKKEPPPKSSFTGFLKLPKCESTPLHADSDGALYCIDEENRCRAANRQRIQSHDS